MPEIRRPGWDPDTMPLVPDGTPLVPDSMPLVEMHEEGDAVAKRLRRFLLGGRNGWLVSVFLLFIFVTLIFAGIYHAIHQKHPASFSFARDIARSQQERFRAAVMDEAKTLEFRILMLERVEESISRPEAQLEFREHGSYEVIAKAGGPHVPGLGTCGSLANVET